MAAIGSGSTELATSISAGTGLTTFNLRIVDISTSSESPPQMLQTQQPDKKNTLKTSLTASSLHLHKESQTHRLAPQIIDTSQTQTKTPKFNPPSLPYLLPNASQKPQKSAFVCLKMKCVDRRGEECGEEWRRAVRRRWCEERGWRWWGCRQVRKQRSARFPILSLSLCYSPFVVLCFVLCVQGLALLERERERS